MTRTHFNHHIGIDYSGRETPTARTGALQVYATSDRRAPKRIESPSATEQKRRNWNRTEIADWLIDQARQKTRFIAGIDHGFSFPIDYFQRYKIHSWPDFLEDFWQHWPTDKDGISVDNIRQKENHQLPRTGSSKDLRLTEKWTSSAKSVFQFDVQGSVAKSTHAGLPWLRKIRNEVGDKVHFWPFDGWKIPEKKSVLAEVFSSIFRNRYPRGDRTADQQDAFCVSRWLSEVDKRGHLTKYFLPPLNGDEERIARLEGWILGIT